MSSPFKEVIARAKEMVVVHTSTADVYSPMSAIGVPKLKEARSLNNVNKRDMLKK